MDILRFCNCVSPRKKRKMAKGGLTCGIYSITNRACETAGVRKISHHDMRHSCATNLVASGEYTLVDAARFLGHKNAFVTANTYAHSPQTHKAAIADSVSKRMQRMAA